MKLTVITLTYNKFDNLAHTLASIENQIFKDQIEVIISDDGSPNYCKENMLEIINQFPTLNIILIHHDNNVGTVKNFNNAIKIASGEIIIPLSQDDCFANNNVLQDINDFFEHHIDYGICTTKRKGQYSNAIVPSSRDCELLEKNDSILLFREMCENIIFGACIYYKKSFLEKMNYFDETYRLMEDHPFVLKSLLMGYKIGFINNVSIVYGENGASAGGKSPQLIADDDRLRSNVILPFYESLSDNKDKLVLGLFLESYEHQKSIQRCLFDNHKLLLLLKYLGKRVLNKLKNGNEQRFWSLYDSL
ncbi:glycosyltransferase family 2 protein [Bilifractor sp. HCP3S3_D3]|uniref:glycosyltransferase family 2 protein n=1 Tax=Bilifractor sp. HCP3S3_D3 TaxID=3438907 RepID=UPI003F89F9A9